MMYERQQIRSNNQIQGQVLVYIHDQIRSFLVDEQLLNMTIEQVKINLIQPKIGYSSRIHLYKQPLCSFNKLSFCPSNAKIVQVMREFGRICFTYNNTQYAEEPDYNHQPVYSRPPSVDSIQTVVQICQNNFFVHQNYRVPISTRIGFFADICSRYGRNAYAQFFNTRISLSEFANDSIVQNTIQRFVDKMNRLTITVDSITQLNQNNSLNFCQISCDFLIQQKFYFKLCVIEEQGKKRYFAISKNCKLTHLRYMLKIIYKQQISLFLPNMIQQAIFDQVNQQKIIYAKLKQQSKRILKLENPIQNCQIIGSKGNLAQNNMQVFVIKDSSILYRIAIDSVNIFCYLITVNHLPCISTTNLDQDLFFIRNGQLLSYAITINNIKLKYYSSQGQLIMLKTFPWYHQLYDIQFSVVDIFCVKLKKNDRKKVRVFFIDDPQNYVEVGPFSAFFPAKIGNNIYSDGSGIFAISNPWAQSVQVHSLTQTTKLCQIRLQNQNYKHLKEVIFSQSNQVKQRKLFLNFSNKFINLYNLGGEFLYSILLDNGMSNFLCIGNQLTCCIGSQLKYFIYQKIDNQITAKWSQSQYIPQKTVLVLQDKLLVRQRQLQFASFNSFYLLSQK